MQLKSSKQFLSKIGVYGFDHLEPVILASLVTEDPLLLIGNAGTGKTYLLNSLSEALNLNHRHYNASYLSFDDLIGFPYPTPDGKAINFIPTPSTIWETESVLIDELSRCRPEIQNKFFSIIHEKKIQGMPLEKLKYRWAAMNPISTFNSDDEELYEGSISLDPALADRFSFILNVPDWNEISDADQEKIIQPAGEGIITDFSIELSVFIDTLQQEFEHIKNHPPIEVIKYCQLAASLLNDAGFRISPRRARLMARNFIGLFLVMNELGFKNTDQERSSIFRLGLNWSLPQRAYKNMTDSVHQIDSIHQSIINMLFSSRKEERWIEQFNQEKLVIKKIDMIFNDNISMEHKSIATLQFLLNGSFKDIAIFCFTAQPALAKMNILNEEALNEVTAIASKIFQIDGVLHWNVNHNASNTQHPQWSACAKHLAQITYKPRKVRASQLYLFLILNDQMVDHTPRSIELELNDCFTEIQTYVNGKISSAQ